MLHSLKLTFSPLKIGRAPKRKFIRTNHPFFRCKIALSFREEKFSRQQKRTVLGGSSQLGYVVNNHGDRKSPKDQVVGPLPNGLLLYGGHKWGAHPNLTTETMPGSPSSKYMDVSKNRGKTPKWMVKIMENPY